MLNFPPMSCFIPLCRIPLSRTAVARAALVVCLGAGSVVHAETALPALGLPNPMPAPDRMVWLPVTQERIETAVAALDALGASMLERSGIPGLAIAVVHKGETIYARGFGKRAANGDADVDADTVFLLASLSKPVGATVVAGQVGTGRIAGASSGVRRSGGLGADRALCVGLRRFIAGVARQCCKKCQTNH